MQLRTGYAGHHSGEAVKWYFLGTLYYCPDVHFSDGPGEGNSMRRGDGYGGGTGNPSGDGCGKPYTRVTDAPSRRVAVIHRPEDPT